MPLPAGSHVVRLCGASQLGDAGEITADCFVPHAGTDDRPADRYLSVHWLEYLSAGLMAANVSTLRQYLLNSPYSRERKPTRNGKLAVLSCDRVVSDAMGTVQIAIDFDHMPRFEHPVASGIEISESGEVRMGVAVYQAKTHALGLDPHSALHTLPAEGAHQLAVQQFLAGQVVYSEPGLGVPGVAIE